MNRSNRNTIGDLAPRQVADLLAAGQILLIDVRAERVCRAASRGRASLSTFDASTLPPDTPRQLVFQCGTGKRSAMAVAARLAAGAPRAAHLAGGIGAWVEAGLPVIHIDPATGKPPVAK